MTKILPNVRVNFLVRFASKPLFYWVMSGNPSNSSENYFGDVRAIFWLCESLLAAECFLSRVLRVGLTEVVDPGRPPE